MRLNLLPVTIVISALLITSCTSHLLQLEEDRNQLADDGRIVAVDVTGCRNQLGKYSNDTESELDTADLRFLSWNIKKTKHSGWREDLLDLGKNRDLVLIQEAVYDPGLIEAFDDLHFWSFSPGYRSGARVTGVVTLSRSEPLARCSLTSWEPWLRTPKATSITEYGLTDTKQTLVVVNFHGVNFTFGVSEFQSQLDQISQVLKVHNGPVIVSGDFNTWRMKRMKIIESFAIDLGLAPLSFEQDTRLKIFGYPVDHIFVRGLTAESATTKAVNSSDHNPMMAEFRL